GSLSRWSSDSHATAGPPAETAASHSASSVVLPNPAGADTSVNAASTADPSRAPSLGRATRSRRGVGTCSLVLSSGPATVPLPGNHLDCRHANPPTTRRNGPTPCDSSKRSFSKPPCPPLWSAPATAPPHGCGPLHETTRRPAPD